MFHSLYDNSSGETVAEVEIISLTERANRLPLYRLRVDPCTAFVGYEHHDFPGVQKAIRELHRHRLLPRRRTSSSRNHTIDVSEALESIPPASDDPWDQVDGAESGDFELTAEQIETTLDYFRKSLVVFFYVKTFFVICDFVSFVSSSGDVQISVTHFNLIPRLRFRSCENKFSLPQILLLACLFAHDHC